MAEQVRSFSDGRFAECCTSADDSGGVDGGGQRYTYRVLQTIQMELILLCVWAEGAVLGSAKSALKFKYEIQIG